MSGHVPLNFQLLVFQFFLILFFYETSGCTYKVEDTKYLYKLLKDVVLQIRTEVQVKS